MRPGTLWLLVFGGGLVFAMIEACGGRVIVDGMASEGGAGGLGGHGGMLPATPSSGSSSLSGPGCNFPAPIGQAANCSATASGGAGSPVTCSVAICDAENNQFASSCNEQTCICSYSPGDGGEPFGCTCSNNSPCGDSAGNCCPFHF